MTACVGNYFRLASLPLLRKITECGNYCKASPDLEHFLPVTGACSGQCFSLRLHFAAWLCTVPLADRHQSLGRLHQDHSLHKQVHDWPLAQTGLNSPNNCPKGNRSLCCASLEVNLSSPCPSTVHRHTPAKPRKHWFYGFFFPPSSAFLSGNSGSVLGSPSCAMVPAPGRSLFLPVLLFQSSLILHY